MPAPLSLSPAFHTASMAEPKGTILFSTVGRPYYGFDIFSVALSSSLQQFSERCLTDGISVNFNANFADEDGTLAYVSERTGAPRIHLNRPGNHKPDRQFSAPGSLFHDRPVLKAGRLYFISAHEPADRLFKSWSALYTIIQDFDNDRTVRRLTPAGSVDYSPAVSLSGQLVAVAAYGSRPWGGEFHELDTAIVVFREAEPEKRVTVCERGGWPSWSGDSTIFFHRRADDGWWSVFRIDLSPDFLAARGGKAGEAPPQRVTPPGLHAFTPAAFPNCGTRIAVATRRRESGFRHIEIFDLESEKFYPVTEAINPNFHHYNPFVSPESGFLGYHRCRGESAARGETIVPHIEPLASPIKALRMLRLNGFFPSPSPDGDLIAVNLSFDSGHAGVQIVKSDGSRRWGLRTGGGTAFYNSWSPTEKNVIYTSLGQIFADSRSTVQIARISFDLSALAADREEEDDVPAEVKILTRGETGNNAFPACSPDGQSIVFRSGRSGHKNLYVMDAAEGEGSGGSGGAGRIRRLTEGPWTDTMPCWSPDGELVAFSSNRHEPENPEVFALYVVRGADGSGLRRVHVTGSDRERLNHVSFSPDGAWVVFSANASGVTAEPVGLPNQFQPYGELYAVRADGSGGLRRLTWGAYEHGTPVWTRGGDGSGEVDVEAERLRTLGSAASDGDKLTKGQFEEPLWINFDF